MPRWLTFLIFFSIFMTIYGAVNVYLFRRGWQALPAGSGWRWGFTGLYLFLALGYIVAEFSEHAGLDHWITGPLTWAGSVWFGLMAYLFLLAGLIDLARLSDRLFHWFPAGCTVDPVRTRLIVTLAVIGVAVLGNAAGAINASIVRTRQIAITLSKPLPGCGRLTVAMASDIHLGTIVGARRMARIRDLINASDPDLVLLPGDIVDEGLHPGRDPELCAILRGIHSRLGVFASTGNHEFIVGLERSLPFIEGCGIRVLRNEAVLLDNGFYLAARDDDAVRYMGKGGRPPLDAVLKDIDHTRPVILMDHTPAGLAAAAEAGVDLQVSGHTHNGQLWPFNYITGLIFEQDWGYHRKGNTQYYISCGAGTWGPPVRTNSAPEVVVFTITGP